MLHFYFNILYTQSKSNACALIGTVFTISIQIYLYIDIDILMNETVFWSVFDGSTNTKMSLLLFR